MPENILTIARKDIQLTWAANTRGGEFCGACPKCGGKDRFLVWPGEGETGRFWCRKCNIKGDAIDYLRLTKKLSFKDATAQVGVVRAPAKLKFVVPTWKGKASHRPSPTIPPLRGISKAAPVIKEIKTTTPGGSPATVDDIQVDASGEAPIVANSTQETPLTSSAGIPAPEAIPTLPEPISNEALTQQWRDMDPLEVLPSGRRDEAAAILLDDPNSRQTLKLCRLGVYDALTAMSLLRMEDPYLCVLNIHENNPEPINHCIAQNIKGG